VFCGGLGEEKTARAKQIISGVLRLRPTPAFNQDFTRVEKAFYRHCAENPLAGKLSCQPGWICLLKSANDCWPPVSGRPAKSMNSVVGAGNAVGIYLPR
jgi:hypothetical protein